jgi:hypothetical protein
VMASAGGVELREAFGLVGAGGGGAHG